MTPYKLNYKFTRSQGPKFTCTKGPKLPSYQAFKLLNHLICLKTPQLELDSEAALTCNLLKYWNTTISKRSNVFTMKMNVRLQRSPLLIQLKLATNTIFFHLAFLYNLCYWVRLKLQCNSKSSILQGGKLLGRPFWVPFMGPIFGKKEGLQGDNIQQIFKHLNPF